MSTDTKKVVPSITATSTVPELVKFTWLSFQPHECTEVETILVNRENEFKSKLEKLEKDNLRLKEEHDLMERKHGLAELKKLKSESELIASKKECQELKEKLEKHAEMLLVAKKNNSIIYSKKLKNEEKLGKFIAELYDEKNIAEEKEKEQSIIISKCNEKIKVLEGEKLKMEEKLGKLIEELNNEKKIAEEKNKMLLVLEKDKSKYISESSEKLMDLEKEKLESEEKLARLIKEFNDEKKITEEKLLVVENEKSRIVSEFTDKIKVLECEILKRDKVVSELSEKMVKVEESKKKVKGFDSKAFIGDANVAEKVKKGSYPIITDQIVDLTESGDDLSNQECEMIKEVENECSGSKRKRSESEGEGGGGEDDEDDEDLVSAQKTMFMKPSNANSRTKESVRRTSKRSTQSL